MLFLLVKNIVRRSMPRPQPPVGGRPCSNAVQKSSSQHCEKKRRVEKRIKEKRSANFIFDNDDEKCFR